MPSIWSIQANFHLTIVGTSNQHQMNRGAVPATLSKLLSCLGREINHPIWSWGVNWSFTMTGFLTSVFYPTIDVYPFLPNFTNSYQILPIFTKFYPVLPMCQTELGADISIIPSLQWTPNYILVYSIQIRIGHCYWWHWFIANREKHQKTEWSFKSHFVDLWIIVRHLLVVAC